MPDVVVSILVLSVFMIAPSSVPSVLKRLRKKCTSSIGRRQLVSSTYAIMIGLLPWLSSRGLLFRRRCSARVSSSLFICLRMCVRNIPANKGERGHPYLG